MLCISGQIRAQEVTASINGAVTDPSGGAVSGAKVTAKDLDRGTASSTTTNELGLYNFPRLPIGRYEVRAENQGFQTAVQSNIVLQLNQAAKIDFQLRVGSVSETVEVTGGPAELQTQTTQLGTVIDARTNEQLPLATRNYVQLTLLAPGAVATDPMQFTGAQTTFGGGRPYINGNRQQANNFILDGMDNNQVSENEVGYAPSVDAIQEFNMITQNASAEFGNFMGGIVSVSLKSGTNQFHGGVFEFFRNDKLNANDWANNWNGLPKPLLRWNEFGGQIGGPIVRDKLFFFADYQGSRFDQPASSTAFTVLTAKERAGDFSELGPQKNPCTGTLTTDLSNCISPVARGIVTSPLYPQPVNGNLINNAVNTTHSSTNGDQGDVKVDYQATEKDRIFGRYSQALVQNPTTNSIALLYNSENRFPTHNGVLDYTRTFGSSFVNEARVGVNYLPVTTGVLSGAALTPQSVGIAGVPTDILPGMVFLAGNLNNCGGSCTVGNPEVFQEFSDTTIQANDTAIWTKGSHTMHFGFQVTRNRIDTFYSGNAGIAGQFDFSGQYTGSPEGDFITGRPKEVQGGIAGGTWGQRDTVFSAFAQDEFRITRNLTFNYGLRWELTTPWYEVKDRQANFGEFSGVQQFPGQNGLNRALYNQYNGITNFQPRVGIAWTPGGGKTVIRAAFTTSSFLEGTGTNLRLTLNPPFATEHDVQFTASQTPSTLSQGYTIFGGATGDQFVGASLRLWDPNNRPAVSNQWNFTVQHELARSLTVQAGYVGQRNTHLMVPVLASQRVLNPDGTLSLGYLAGNPTLANEIGAAKLTDSNGNQDYHALQVVVQKRLGNGLEFQTSYTWSKCMTNSIGYYGSGGQARGDHYYWQNTYNSAAEWGPCFYDVTHAFNGFVTYDIPFGRGRAYGQNVNKVVNAALGDWQVNSILSFRGGFPITILSPVDTSQSGSFGSRANCVAGGNVFGRMNSAGGGFQWFDPNSYAAPALGTFGNCGVGTIRGPGLMSVDLSLSKLFRFTEHQNLEFRAEAINFSNTPILNAPNDNLGSTLGQITASQGARNVQFGLKYNF